MKLKYHRRRSNFEYTNITGRALYTNDIGLNPVQASLRTDLWKVNGIWYFLLDGIIYKIRNDQYIEVGHCDGGRITTLDTGYLCTTTSEDYTTWWYKIYDAEDHLVSELALESCTKIGYDADFIYFKCHGGIYCAWDRTNFKLKEIQLGRSKIYNYRVINNHIGCFSGDAGLIFWDFVEQKVLMHINSIFRGWCFDEVYSFGLTARMTKISKFIFLKDYRDYYLVEREYHSPSQTNLLGMGLFLDGDLLYYVSGLNPEKKMVLGVMDLTTNECIDEVKIEVEPETYILGLFMCHDLICVLTNKQYVLEYQLVNEKF